MRLDLRLLLVALPLALVACGETGKAPAGGTAGGEVLPGSASDAMLPVDTVRSQPPLAPKSQPSGAKEAKAGDSGKSDASTAEGEAEPPAAPEAPVPAVPAVQ